MLKIKRVILSVYSREKLEEFAKNLKKFDIEIYATPGTHDFLKSRKIDSKPILDLSSLKKEVLGGRVKTLDQKIFSSILADKSNAQHMKEIEKLKIPSVDMVVVDLYPFEKNDYSRKEFEEMIELIDIGGISLLRAAAKNFRSVVPVPSIDYYDKIIDALKENNGSIPLKLRLELAKLSFERTFVYDYHIFSYFSELKVEDGEIVGIKKEKSEINKNIYLMLSREKILRYGENPHQEAGLYYNLINPIDGWINANQISGIEPSFNNYLDMESAYSIVRDFEKCCCAIVKHNNPCGVAIGETPADAFSRALLTDQDSAFGSIIAFNKTVDEECAKELKNLFFEVILAPNYTKEAISILKRKKRLRIFQKKINKLEKFRHLDFRKIEGGYLVQTPDICTINPKDVKVVTKRKPDKETFEDLIFAWKCVKNVKSNAIVIAREERTIGIGAGQMSRVDSAKIAIMKSRSPIVGAVLASDGFIPFRDTIDVAAENGIIAVIQPGGSIRDEEVIAAANENNIAMVFTGIRHFRH